MKYYIEIKIDDEMQMKRVWVKLRPTNGQPYEFETQSEAQQMINICYGDNPIDVRITKENRK